MKQAFVLFIATVVMAAGSAWSADAPKKGKAETKGKVTRETRNQMASMHDKMANCLKSDRPMNECRAEMMESCHEMMDQGGCPMMGEMGGHGMHGRGGMMGGMMDHSEESSQQKQPKKDQKK